MTNPFTPLSEEEFDELDQFLLYDVDREEVMVADIMDGFMHAIAVGPTTLHPKQWLPKIWGTQEMRPPMDSIEHLNHMVNVMGIEHVGIGTDFDGDGGITGCASASELINFTRRLLLERYSEENIRLIWGGNFLRVMEEVQRK